MKSSICFHSPTDTDYLGFSFCVFCSYYFPLATRFLFAPPYYLTPELANSIAGVLFTWLQGLQLPTLKAI